MHMLIYVSIFLFFFSSRRRHTRLQGDWSSDVCSSDLPSRSGAPLLLRHGEEDLLAIAHDGRSEERRVGKECRSRGSPDNEKKKKEKGKMQKSEEGVIYKVQRRYQHKGAI